MAFKLKDETKLSRPVNGSSSRSYPSDNPADILQHGCPCLGSIEPTVQCTFLENEVQHIDKQFHTVAEAMGVIQKYESIIDVDIENRKAYVRVTGQSARTWKQL